MQFACLRAAHNTWYVMLSKSQIRLVPRQRAANQLSAFNSLANLTSYNSCGYTDIAWHNVHQLAATAAMCEAS